MASNAEMTIPRESGLFHLVMYTIVAGFLLLAVYALVNRIALIAPCLWLAFVSMTVRSNCRAEGGIRPFLVNCLGNVTGRRFAAIGAPGEIQFGYRLLGRRFIQERIALGKIESVEWSPGQASSMAGRDMNDWHVVLWFHHDDPARSQRRQRLRKPDQDPCIIGPSRRKEETAALGLGIVAFLQSAGVTLVPGEKETGFVRHAAG